MRMDAHTDRKEAELLPQVGEAEIDIAASAAPAKNLPKNRPKNRARGAFAIKDALINCSQQIRLAG